MRLGRASLVVVMLIGSLVSVGGPVQKVEEAKAQTTSMPNIVVIVTDDQRKPDTANMEQLENAFKTNGTTYSNAFVTTSLCCPSRASIFSGQYVHNHGVTQLTNPAELDQRHTLQYQLQKRGYNTGIVGKYLNGWNYCNGEGDTDGREFHANGSDPPYFDRYAVYSGGYDNIELREWWTKNEPGGRCKPYDYSTTAIRDKALNYIDEFASESKPFFLYVAPFAPHGPASPAPAYRNGSKTCPTPTWNKNDAIGEADLGDKPPHVRLRGTDVYPRPAFVTSTQIDSDLKKDRLDRICSLEPVDDMVGDIMGKLSDRGIRNNTLAIFTTDNGFLLGEHKLKGKREPYHYSSNVPFFVKWPAMPALVPPNTTDTRIVANIDIAPTIYDLTGGPPVDNPTTLENEGYVPDGRSIFTSNRQEILLEHFVSSAGELSDCLPTWAALRSKTYLYRKNFYGESREWDAMRDADKRSCTLSTWDKYIAAAWHHEYYDVQSDPWNLRNLMNDGDPNTAPSTTTNTLSTRLEQARTCSGATCP